MELSKEMKEAINFCSCQMLEAMDESWYKRNDALKEGLETLVKRIFEEVSSSSLKVTGIVTPKND